MLNEFVDYFYYIDEYRGSSIPRPLFEKYEIKARSKINYYTSNKINEDNLDNNIKNATCEIAEIIYEQELLKDKILIDSKEIASESLGPKSVSYVNKINYQSKLVKTESELNKTIYQVCKEKISSTGLMYRGVL